MDVDGDKEDVEMASESESDGGSSDDEAKEEELKKKKETLTKMIENDKTDYYAYVELIEVLSKLSQLTDLRKIREDFSREYPLTAEIWLSWIKDENKIATTAEEKEHIGTLFERALQDYLSIDVWLEYIQFSIGRLADSSRVECVRVIVERALSICGYNVAKGSLLWELYREFETLILSSLATKCELGQEDESVVREQKRRIAEIFRRQLSIPLLGMENTYEELRSWLKNEENSNEIIDMNALETSYRKALEKLSQILAFEDSLACCEGEATLPIYQTYLEFEKNPREGGNDTFRVRCLYERALIDNPLNRDLWNDYIGYLSEVVRIPEDTMSACHRATRNCPHVVTFWNLLMILKEKSNKSKEEIKELLNKALQSLSISKSNPLWVWLSYIIYLRRQLYLIPREDRDERTKSIDEIRKVADMAFENLTENFGSKGDPNCELWMWLARFEAETCRDLERFRLIWTDIMNSGCSSRSSYWLKYIQMEWQYGDAKHMRRLCPRALSSIKGSPKEITAVWLDYESQIGSLDSFLNCQRICDEKLKEYSKKEANERLGDKKNKLLPKSENKKVTEESHNNSKDTVGRKIDGFAKKDSADKFKKTEPDHDPAKDCRTVFISNLHSSVVEEDVKEVLSSVGTVEELKFVRDRQGRFLGFGHIIFSSEYEAREALKLDRTPLKRRPMFISEFDADRLSRKKGLKFNTGLEKNKLFVKGLPFTVNKVALEKLFGQYGVLKDVRMVTYRDGKPKGMAYIEFESETSAAHAMLKTDGLEIEGRTISVAISDPPERKSGPLPTSSETGLISRVALGGGTVGDKNEFGSRGRGRTQLSFIPRAVATTIKTDESNTSDKMDVADSSSSSSSDKKSLSNAEFRNMLFNSK